MLSIIWFHQKKKEAWCCGFSVYSNGNSDRDSTRMMRNCHSSGQRCTLWHTLLMVSSTEVSPQIAALIEVRHCIPRIKSIGVDQISSHQLHNRCVFFWIIQFQVLSHSFLDAVYESWVKGNSKTPLPGGQLGSTTRAPGRFWKAIQEDGLQPPPACSIVLSRHQLHYNQHI